MHQAPATVLPILALELEWTRFQPSKTSGHFSGVNMESFQAECEDPDAGEEPTHQPSVAILAQAQQGGCRLTLLHGKRDHVHLLIQISPRRVSYRTP